MTADSPRILVVEDERDIRLLVEYNLRRGGCYVSHAGSLEAARRALERVRPHLIVLDVMLPDGSGLDLCRELKSDPATAAIVVLFVSALVQPADRQKGIAAGGDGYITKPFAVRGLLDCVRDHLETPPSNHNEARRPEDVHGARLRPQLRS